MTDLEARTRFANADRLAIVEPGSHDSQFNITIRVELDPTDGGAAVKLATYSHNVTIDLTYAEREMLAKALWSTLS
jgi:hypothetical protein